MRDQTDMAIHAPATSMEPLSARIPGDLYLWLAQLRVEGATTNSDKLRVLLGQLKRQHDGALDYVPQPMPGRGTDGAACASPWSVSEGRPGDALGGGGRSSISLTAAWRWSSARRPKDASQAAKVRRRARPKELCPVRDLAATGRHGSAAAHDPEVIRRHVATTVEIAMSLPLKKGA
jgi:hypothetical protein